MGGVVVWWHPPKETQHGFWFYFWFSFKTLPKMGTNSQKTRDLDAAPTSADIRWTASHHKAWLHPTGSTRRDGEIRDDGDRGKPQRLTYCNPPEKVHQLKAKALPYADGGKPPSRCCSHAADSAPSPKKEVPAQKQIPTLTLTPICCSHSWHLGSQVRKQNTPIC